MAPPLTNGIQRRRRLGLPKVNENPQPPNARQIGSRTLDKTTRQTTPPADVTVTNPTYDRIGQGNNGPNRPRHDGGPDRRPDPHQHAGARRRALNQLRRRENRLGDAISTPSTPVTAAPTALNAQTVQEQIDALHGNPANALAFSSFTPGPGQVDPRDSQYWANVNNLLFNTQADYSNLQLQGSRAATDHDAELGEIATSRSREQRALAEQAMRSGLSSSGWRDRSDAEDTADFLSDFEGFNNNYARSNSDRAATMSRVIQDFVGGERDLSLDAVSSYDERQRQAAEEGTPVYDASDVKALKKALSRGHKRKGRKNR